jgi:hypothetical protein
LVFPWWHLDLLFDFLFDVLAPVQFGISLAADARGQATADQDRGCLLCDHHVEALLTLGLDPCDVEVFQVQDEFLVEVPETLVSVEGLPTRVDFLGVLQEVNEGFQLLDLALILDFPQN